MDPQWRWYWFLDLHVVALGIIVSLLSLGWVATARTGAIPYAGVVGLVALAHLLLLSPTVLTRWTDKKGRDERAMRYLVSNFAMVALWAFGAGSLCALVLMKMNS